MTRRWVLLLALVLGATGVPAPAGAADPAPGTILYAQRLIRFDSRTQTTELTARFRVQGYPGDTADGELRVYLGGTAFHAKAVPSPCADPAGDCGAVWDVTLSDWDRGGNFGVPGPQQVELTVHDAAGVAHDLDLGEVVVQHLTPAAATARSTATAAEVVSARRVGTCARVRALTRTIRVRSGVGCRAPRRSQERARVILELAVPTVPDFHVLQQVQPHLRLRRSGGAGRVRVAMRVTGLDLGWRRCSLPTGPRRTRVSCHHQPATDDTTSFGVLQLRVRVTRGARVVVRRAGVDAFASAWVS